MPRISARFGWLFALLVLTTACRKPSVEDLPGTYSINYSFGTETLVIHANGEYAQTIVITGNPAPITSTGTWSYTPEDGEIALENHLIVQDGYGNLNPNPDERARHWLSVMAVRKGVSNSITITASADGAGFDYRKTTR